MTPPAVQPLAAPPHRLVAHAQRAQAVALARAPVHVRRADHCVGAKTMVALGRPRRLQALNPALRAASAAGRIIPAPTRPELGAFDIWVDTSDPERPAYVCA